MGRSPVKFVAFSFLFLALCYLFLYKTDRVVVDAAAMDNMQDYDILLAQGQSVHSKVVKLFNGSNDAYSHIGILLKEGGKVYVLHATPDGTETNGIRYDSLQNFFDLSDVCSYTVLRHQRLNDEFRKKLSAEINHFKTHPAPFDYDFNNHEHGKLYCSELVWLVFKNVGLMEEGVFDLDEPIYPGQFLRPGIRLEVPQPKTAKRFN
ncbi:MAG: YiiX/YebB-like N1pC/P60 family cysteine hydrolase [Bacteroidia bacterium]